MRETQVLAERFEANRTHLQAVAYRMLGSLHEADDAVQEAWLRLNRSDVSGVDNLRGWLTTVVARVCLDMLRSRKSRREEPLALDGLFPGGQVSNLTPEPAGAEALDPEQEAILADSVGLALLVVLDRLAPAERVAFVLHDIFDLPFDEIAPIVGRQPAAARQHSSRARRRVRGAGAQDTDRSRQRAIVEAFLAAAREGDFRALLAVLDPEIVLRADSASVQWSVAQRGPGVPKLAPAVRGAPAVARALSGTTKAAQLALVNGAPGLVWAPAGRPGAAMRFTVVRGKIVEIDLIADPEHIRRLDLVIGQR
jgi:RNA polymerase sigma-70 factor (ECF subfamily)